MSIRKSVLCLLLFLISSLTFIGKTDAEEKDIILEAMEAELARSVKELKLPNFKKPYFISYSVGDSRAYAVEAKYGALFNKNDLKNRMAYVEVRVGDYQLDSSILDKYEAFFDSDDFGIDVYSLRSAPIEDDIDALRFALWRQTDYKYKKAIKTYNKKLGKLADSMADDRDVPDFSREEAHKYFHKSMNFTLDKKYWDDLIRKESAYFKKYKDIYDSGIRLSASLTKTYVVNSEGTAIKDEGISFFLSIHARSRCDDGAPLFNVKQFSRRSLNNLPTPEEIHSKVEELVSELSLLRDAPVLDPINVPAILHPQAAGVFFHETIGHRLEGERQRNEKEGQTFSGKLNKPILPDFISIYDDPSLESLGGEELNGSYHYDDEGIPAQKILLVENGILKNFLLSRTPIKEFNKSNGHGRSSWYGEPQARMANLIIKSTKELPAGTLKEMLIEEAKKQKKPFGLLVKNTVGGATQTRKSFFGSSMSQVFRTVPIMVYKVDVNTGEETLVRGVELIGTPLMNIDKLLATGTDYEVFNGYCGAESGSIPVSVYSPSLLLKEIELQKTTGKKKRPHILEPPGKN